MAPPPEYDKEPKAPDKSATNISGEESKALHNLINDQQINSDSKSANTAPSDETEVDEDVEDQKTKKICEDLGVDDQSINKIRKCLKKDEPVKLPMDGGPVTHVRPIMAIKKEPLVKQEPLQNELEKKPFVDIKMEIPEDSDVVNLLTTNKSTVMLIQFPDTLPMCGSAVDDSLQIDATVQPSTSSPDCKNEVPEERKCYLPNLEVGCMGKIRIHHSGRVSFLLGNTTFEVGYGTKTAFYQEIISMTVDENSRSANLVSLGPFQHKLTIVPDWDKLLADE